MSVCVNCKERGKHCFGDCAVRNPKPNIQAFLRNNDKRLVGRSYPDRGWLLKPCKH